jgi:subtilisin family serine protease
LAASAEFSPKYTSYVLFSQKNFCYNLIGRSPQETTMRNIVFIVAGLLAIGSSPSFIGRAHAQATPGMAFVPGELIVGYYTEQDVQDAKQKIANATDDVRVRGNRPAGIQVEEHGGASLVIHIEFPESIRQATRGNPASELALLQELAQQIKQNDSRVKYAQPNYILQNVRPPDPPTMLQGLPTQPQSAPQESPQSAPQSNALANDALFSAGLQWPLMPLPGGMNAVGAWAAVGHGGRDVVVAVIDSGILFDHEDIKGSGNVVQGYNFVSANSCVEKDETPQPLARSDDATDPGDACLLKDTTDPRYKKDPAWHGTHVAGIIGAVSSNNGLGIAGIAWGVTIVPVRALGSGGGKTTDLADAVLWAAGLPVPGVPQNTHPADIINMSLGGAGSCDELPKLADAITAARGQGAVVVVAAGNDTVDIKDTHLATCPGVISVAAAGPQGTLAPYSNYGNVTILAPGGDGKFTKPFFVLGVNQTLPLDVWSTVKGQNGVPYGGMDGTSQATPHVSGAIALALSAHPEWRRKPDVIESVLRHSAATLPPGACPADKPCGVGQLDAGALVTETYRPSPWEQSSPSIVAPPRPSPLDDLLGSLPRVQ